MRAVRVTRCSRSIGQPGEPVGRVMRCFCDFELIGPRGSGSPVNEVAASAPKPFNIDLSNAVSSSPDRSKAYSDGWQQGVTSESPSLRQHTNPPEKSMAWKGVRERSERHCAPVPWHNSRELVANFRSPRTDLAPVSSAISRSPRANLLMWFIDAAATIRLLAPRHCLSGC